MFSQTTAQHEPNYGEDVKKEKANLQSLRIVLSSKEPSHLTNVVNTLKDKAKESEVPVKGPVRLPVKTLRITTRKTPCGEGSKTWDRFQLRIHKWFLDIQCSESDFKNLLSANFDPNVNISIISK